MRMATRQGGRNRPNVDVMSLGHYKLHGDPDRVRLTVPEHAAPQFPRVLGTTVDVRRIDPADGDAYLEVHPVDIPDDGGE